MINVVAEDVVHYSSTSYAVGHWVGVATMVLLAVLLVGKYVLGRRGAPTPPSSNAPSTGSPWSTGAPQDGPVQRPVVLGRDVLPASRRRVRR